MKTMRRLMPIPIYTPTRQLVSTWLAVGLLVSTLLVVMACSSGYEVTDEDRAQIQTMLDTYLPLLGDAYSDGDVDVLAAVAAERERARINRRIYDLRQEGRRLEAKMRTFTIEDIVIWNHANAYVTTLETWDLEVFAVGTAFRMSSAEDQPNRVKYQLKRYGDGWQVLHRELEETL